MSYTIEEIRMIEKFMTDHKDDLKETNKFDALDELHYSMVRNVLFERCVDSGLTRTFISVGDEYKDENAHLLDINPGIRKDKEIKLDNYAGMISMLMIKGESIHIGNANKEALGLSTVIINSTSGNPYMDMAAADIIVLSDLLGDNRNKDIKDLVENYINFITGKKTEVKSNEAEVISTRPAPKPTITKEVIDSKKAEEIKNEIDAKSVDKAFDTVLEKRTENGTYPAYDEFEEKLKRDGLTDPTPAEVQAMLKEEEDAKNLLGIKTTEDMVEEHVEKTKTPTYSSSEGGVTKGLFGGKEFTFGKGVGEENADSPVNLKMAKGKYTTKKPEFDDVNYIKEGENEDGTPLKFSEADKLEIKFGEAPKDGISSIDLSSLKAPADIRTLFYLDETDGTLINYTEEEKEQFKHWEVAKKNPNLVIIDNGRIKKANGEKFTPKEWQVLKKNFELYATNENLAKGLAEGSIEVMDIFVREDLFNDEAEIYNYVYSEEELNKEDEEEEERDTIWGNVRIDGSEL